MPAYVFRRAFSSADLIPGARFSVPAFEAVELSARQAADIDAAAPGTIEPYGARVVGLPYEEPQPVAAFTSPAER